MLWHVLLGYKAILILYLRDGLSTCSGQSEQVQAGKEKALQVQKGRRKSFWHSAHVALYLFEKHSLHLVKSPSLPYSQSNALDACKLNTRCNHILYKKGLPCMLSSSWTAVPASPSQTSSFPSAAAVAKRLPAASQLQHLAESWCPTSACRAAPPSVSQMMTRRSFAHDASCTG